MVSCVSRTGKGFHVWETRGGKRLGSLLVGGSGAAQSFAKCLICYLHDVGVMDDCCDSKNYDLSSAVTIWW